MKLSKTNNSYNPNFRGMYRLNYTEKNLNEVVQKVLPMYEMISKEKASVFEENPLQLIIKEKLEKIADDFHYSFDWLVQNSQRHGIDLSYIDKNSIIVLTKKKDNQSFLEKISKVNKDHSIFQKIKNIFNSKNFYDEVAEYVSTKPEHLKEVAGIDYVYKKEIKRFNECLSSFDIVDVKTPQELLQKMFLEK